MQRHKLGNWYLNEKGYPRFCSGPYRGRYVHRVLMALKLGRELRKDEDVDHKNRNKQDFRLRNLRVLDHAYHGWVSSKQYWYMKRKDAQQKREWDDHFSGEKHVNSSAASVGA